MIITCFLASFFRYIGKSDTFPDSSQIVPSQIPWFFTVLFTFPSSNSLDQRNNTVTNQGTLLTLFTPAHKGVNFP